MKLLVDSIRLAVGGCAGWRRHRFWYRQLWRFKTAMAMIDERLNFNQIGARSIFREVNRLISQALLPSSLSFSPTPSSARDHFWHRHAIHLFPISTSPCSFPSPPYAPHPPPLPLLHISSTSQEKWQPPPLEPTLSGISHYHMRGNSNIKAARLISHRIIHHKIMRWEESIQQTEAIHRFLACIIRGT